MTLAPYWKRFLPASATSSAAVKAQNLCRGRNANTSKNPRFCPACIEADTAIHGSAYWHREHQLPNVFGCGKHHLRLLERCFACGQLPRKHTSTSICPLSTRCECGADLRLQSDVLEAPALYWHLVHFSTDALTAPPFFLPEDSVTTFLRQLSSDPKPVQFNAALSSAKERLTPPGIDLALSLSDRRSSRELCILFASQGQSLAEALTQLSRASSRIGRATEKLSWRTDQSIRGCRDSLQSWMSLHPHAGPAFAGELYWRIRLLDGQWLAKQFPHNHRDTIPSVADDRRVVRRFLRNSDRRNAVWTTAGLRAGIRDTNWFRAALTSSLKQMREQQTAADSVKQGKLLDSAVHALKRAEPPVKISYARLAQCTGLPLFKVGRIVRADRGLSALIRDANSTKTYRLLKWVAEDILLSGEPLQSTAWAARTKVPTDRRTTKMMYAIATELSALGFEVGARWMPDRPSRGGPRQLSS